MVYGKQPPILRYLTDATARDNRIALAQEAADQLGIGLDVVLAALRNLPASAVTAAREDGAAIQLRSVTHIGPVSFADGVVTGWEEVRTYRFPDMEKLSSDLPKNRATISANQLILIAVLFVAAIYPVLPPDLQRYLATEAGLMSALAAILTLLKSERKK